MRHLTAVKGITRTPSAFSGIPLLFLHILVILGMTTLPAFGQDSQTQDAGGGWIMAMLTAQEWSPYAVGVGIGLLSWATFFLSNQPIGVSGTVARASGMVEKLARGSHITEKPYYQHIGLRFGWDFTFVGGIVLGSLFSASLSGDFQLVMLPDLWQNTFGSTPLLRWGTAFLGGVVLMFGARLAGGCTSGHGISGTLQLVLSSWIALLCFFVGGVITASLIY
ncbi:MAG: YeeE/YedE thiosulfate transporter family protein [Thermodesulfobacteriota bacterium]